MEAVQTVGREIYKGAHFSILTTRTLELYSGSDKQLFQLLYVDEGTVLMEDDSGAVSLFAPVLLCVNYKKPLSSVSLHQAKGFSILFRPDVINHGMLALDDFTKLLEDFKSEQVLLNPFLKGGEGNPFYLPVNALIRDRLLRMADNLELQLGRQPDEYWPCRGRSFFLEMLILLQTMFALEGHMSVRLPQLGPQLEPLLRSFHTEYFDPKLSMARYAKSVRGNRLGLAYKFRQGTGVWPSRYLLNIRMNFAANLARNTILAFPEIAKRAGYTSLRTFSTHFKKAFTLSPEAYRAQHPDPYG